MKLATLDNGTRDGRLVIVSRDHARAVSADGIATTLQDAIKHVAHAAHTRPLCAGTIIGARA